jgi:hypothetical protein
VYVTSAEAEAYWAKLSEKYDDIDFALVGTGVHDRAVEFLIHDALRRKEAGTNEA